MLSYRHELEKIGIARSAAVSYQGFASRPKSLRQAMRSMRFPTSDQWAQVSDLFRDDDWTDEVQGVAWDGTHWLFSTNANQSKIDHEDKAIYVFAGGEPLGDDAWISRLAFKDIPHPQAGTLESESHYGQLCFAQGKLFVAHFWTHPTIQGSNVIVFTVENGHLTLDHWIPLAQPTSPTTGRTAQVEFQAINPWDGLLYTCFGDGIIDEFFLYDQQGAWTGKTLKLEPPVTKVQGACFSPNGHLYIASNEKLPGDAKYQTIWYYSALNGKRLGVIPVLAEDDEDYEEGESHSQELEGICFANVQFSTGLRAQIHAILLENHSGAAQMALDNIYFKSFHAADRELV